MATVLIENRHVTCPHCGEEFEVKRKNDGGATYVQEWKTLNKSHLDILQIWISRENLWSMPRTKEFAYKLCTGYGLKMNPGPFFSRISELVGLRIMSQSGQKKENPHYTSKAPEYTINMDLACKVLNAGGKLDV